MFLIFFFRDLYKYFVHVSAIHRQQYTFGEQYYFIVKINKYKTVKITTCSNCNSILSGVDPGGAPGARALPPPLKLEKI